MLTAFLKLGLFAFVLKVVYEDCYITVLPGCKIEGKWQLDKSLARFGVNTHFTEQFEHTALSKNETVTSNFKYVAKPDTNLAVCTP